MAKLTLTDVSNLTGEEQTAITNINNNSAAIEQALENTLSRDGTSPNQMNADLDMNNNDILNAFIEGIDFSSISALADGEFFIKDGTRFVSGGSAADITNAQTYANQAATSAQALESSVSRIEAMGQIYVDEYRGEGIAEHTAIKNACNAAAALVEAGNLIASTVQVHFPNEYIELDQHIHLNDHAGIELVHPRLKRSASYVSPTPKTITNITVASDVVTVTTSSNHGYVNGDKVVITEVFGCGALDTRTYTVAGATATTFQLSGYTPSTDPTGLSPVDNPYVSGGRVTKFDNMFLLDCSGDGAYSNSYLKITRPEIVGGGPGSHTSGIHIANAYRSVIDYPVIGRCDDYLLMYGPTINLHKTINGGLVSELDSDDSDLFNESNYTGWTAYIAITCGDIRLEIDGGWGGNQGNAGRVWDRSNGPVFYHKCHFYGTTWSPSHKFKGSLWRFDNHGGVKILAGCYIDTGVIEYNGGLLIIDDANIFFRLGAVAPASLDSYIEAKAPVPGAYGLILCNGTNIMDDGYQFIKDTSTGGNSWANLGGLEQVPGYDVSMHNNPLVESVNGFHDTVRIFQTLSTSVGSCIGFRSGAGNRILKVGAAGADSDFRLATNTAALVPGGDSEFFRVYSQTGVTNCFGYAIGNVNLAHPILACVVQSDGIIYSYNKQGDGTGISVQRTTNGIYVVSHPSNVLIHAQANDADTCTVTYHNPITTSVVTKVSGTATDKQFFLTAYATNSQLSTPPFITNGTFDTNVTGWTAGINTPVLTWASGTLNLGSSTGYANIYQTIPTVVGGVYRLSGQIVSVTGAGSVGYIRKTDSTNYASPNLVNAADAAAPGWYDSNFTATATTSYIHLINGPAGTSTNFDNINVVRIS